MSNTLHILTLLSISLAARLVNQLGTFLSCGSIRRSDCGNYTVYVLFSGLIRRSDCGYYIVYGMSRGSIRRCDCGNYTVYVLFSGLIRRSDCGYYIVYDMSRGSIRRCDCGQLHCATSLFRYFSSHTILRMNQ